MPYKIVQTIERGRPVLTAVPHEWENDGILAWPKKHEKLRRNEASKPEPNWKKIDCIVKRSGLQSVRQAEIEIDAMSNFSDTETDNERPSRTPCNKANIEKINFNKIAEDCSQEILTKQLQTKKKFVIIQGDTNNIPAIERQNSIENVIEVPQEILTQQLQTKKKFVTIQDDTNNIPAIERQNSIENGIEVPQVRVIAENSPPPNTVLNVIDVNEAMTQVLTKIDSIAEDVKNINAVQTTITQNQQSLFENQNNIILKLVEIETKFEECIKQVFKSPKQNQTADVKPVDTLKELQELENSLRNSDFEEKLKQQVQIVCSKGKKRGINNAYALIDVLFSRSFLNECSWAGGSKSKEPKICLKGFTKTLEFFFSIVHESDPDFSKPDMQKFFLTILKNSQQRLQSKQIRTSTKRNRQKVLKVTKASSSKESIPENLQSDDESETNKNREKVIRVTKASSSKGSVSENLQSGDDSETHKNREKVLNVTKASGSKDSIPENLQSDDESESDYLL